MTLLAVVGLVFVFAVVGGAVVVASVRRRFAEANEIVPGVATPAPAAWAGAHTPEARLHRRLRDAVLALRANPGLEGVSLGEARASLERHVLAVDERLVTVAALPEHLRAEPLTNVAAAVEAVEQAVAALAGSGGTAEGRAELERAVAEVDERVALLAEARAELEGTTPAEEPPSAPGVDTG